jgi:7,8-dihydropterin-6-yl-methyl-4-(beta-D-ribofuranosyl)aminobenzene 5'-phosphate synthase
VNQVPTCTKVTILVDNNVAPGLGLKPEHGFAALVEQDSRRWLFDTGQGPALAHNTSVLDIDLTGLTAVALSHGHYDHTGGLLDVVKLNPTIEIISHPGAFGMHFSLRQGRTAPRDIGMPNKEHVFELNQIRFRPVTSFEQILDQAWFTGEVPRRFACKSDPGLLTPTTNGFRRDPIIDDASVLLETASGPVLLLGCAHAGVRNILSYVREQRGVTELAAVIGGTHLGLSDPAETPEAIQAFEDFNVRRLAPCHCTGEGPAAKLKAYFGQRFQDAHAGAVFEF